jgi:hypothetical protein
VLYSIIVDIHVGRWWGEGLACQSGALLFYFYMAACGWNTTDDELGNFSTLAVAILHSHGIETFLRVFVASRAWSLLSPWLPAKAD